MKEKIIIPYSEEKRNEIVKRIFCRESINQLCVDYEVGRQTIYAIKRSKWFKSKAEQLKEVINQAELK